MPLNILGLGAGTHSMIAFSCSKQEFVNTILVLILIGNWDLKVEAVELVLGLGGASALPLVVNIEHPRSHSRALILTRVKTIAKHQLITQRSPPRRLFLLRSKYLSILFLKSSVRTFCQTIY